MDKIEKFKAMEKVLRELEDLKNSETAVIKKIGLIETENMNLNIQELEKSIATIYDGAYKNLENIEGLHTSFVETVSDFKEKNNITDEMLLEIREANQPMNNKINQKSRSDERLFWFKMACKLIAL